MVRRTTLLSLLIALAIAACGADDDEAVRDVPGDADPAHAHVIDEWAMALTRGDIDAAAAFFAIPSVAENGPLLYEIEDLGDAALFNASLPCGAELVEATAEGEFTIATFRLTERPGPGSCGDGAGATARTAFAIEDGKITEWRRAPIAGEEEPGTEI